MSLCAVNDLVREKYYAPSWRSRHALDLCCLCSPVIFAFISDSAVKRSKSPLSNCQMKRASRSRAESSSVGRGPVPVFPKTDPVQPGKSLENILTSQRLSAEGD